MKKKNLLLSLFAILALTSCGKSNDNFKLSVAFPNGAPALSQYDIAYSLINNESPSITNTKLSDAASIKAGLIDKQYDLIIAPANLGAQVYNTNQSYTMLCGLTYGNIYFASTTKIETIDDLNNMNFVSFSKGSITDLVSSYIIKESNVSVTTTYMDSAADTKTALVADQKENTVYLVADPTASASKIALNKQNKECYLVSVEDVWKSITGYDGFVQAALFVKKDTFNDHKEVVLDYLDRLEKSCNNLNDLSKLSENNKKITELGYFNLPDAVLKSAIPGCNIKYRKASDIKDMFERTYNLNLSLVGGKLPDEGFYQI